MMAASPKLRTFHRVWNGLANQALPPLVDMAHWQQMATNNRTQLERQRDLTTGLLEFALKNR